MSALTFDVSKRNTLGRCVDGRTDHKCVLAVKKNKNIIQKDKNLKKNSPSLQLCVALENFYIKVDFQSLNRYLYKCASYANFAKL